MLSYEILKEIRAVICLVPHEDKGHIVLEQVTRHPSFIFLYLLFFVLFFFPFLFIPSPSFRSVFSWFTVCCRFAMCKRNASLAFLPAFSKPSMLAIFAHFKLFFRKYRVEMCAAVKCMLLICYAACARLCALFYVLCDEKQLVSGAKVCCFSSQSMLLYVVKLCVLCPEDARFRV